MRQILATLLLALLATAVLPAQQEKMNGIAGTTYVIAYPDTTTHLFDIRHPNTRHPDKAYIFIYSAVDNRVVIRGAGFNKTELLQAGKFTIVDLMDATARARQPIADTSNTPTGATFRLESDQPIVVYCYLLTRFGTEAWTPLPVESWGMEYFVAARPGEMVSDIDPNGSFEYTAKAKMAPAEITIVAAYDDTRISISPNGPLLNFPRISNVLLQAGQVYQVQSYVDTSIFADLQGDLGGSYVFATKPIGVLSGNTASKVIEMQNGLEKNAFKNMLIEWLSPVEHHGTEFVYMPTWDARRPTGAPGEDMTSKRRGEMVRIYGTREGVTKVYSLDSNGRTDFTISGRGKFHEDFIQNSVARYYRTDKPAQAMMNSTAVIKYNGTTQGFGNYIGVQYDGWGAYMVEMVPRERWSSFAPYYCSGQPAGMEHFINVVTDSAHQYDVYMENGQIFNFNRGMIPGSGLIWGTMSVTTSRDHYLEGRNGARFSGYLYGIYRGHEEFSPSTTRKDSDADIQSERPAEDEAALLAANGHYDEYLAVAYGYPLASRHVVVGPGDSLKISTSMNCSDLTIRTLAINQNPVGLQVIRLDSAVNAGFTSVQPQPITGASAATIVISPIRRDQDARAIVVIGDRTGKQWQVRYTYVAERLAADPVGLLRNYGVISPGASATREITFTNPLDRTIEITEASLLFGDQSFTIDSVIPGPLPVSLAKGESIRFVVRASPLLANRSYVDTLRVGFGCEKISVAVSVSTSAPRIEISDIDFGVLGVGVTATKQMRVCNTGSGTLEFREGPGGKLVEWLDSHFTISQDQMQQLRIVSLGSAQCLEIAVGFRSETEGIYRDSAQLFANVRDRRDWSIWKAQVRKISAVAGGSEAARAVSVQPNPVTGATTFGFTLARPESVRLVIVDAGGREVAVVERSLAAGEQSLAWDASGLPAGVYFYRLSGGGVGASGSVVVVR